MLLASLLLFSCDGNGDKPPRIEPTFIEVAGSFSSGEQADGIASYTNASRGVSVSGSTLDRHAEPYAYDGWIEVSVRPGFITGISGGVAVEDSWGETHWYIQAQEGKVDTVAQVASVFGDTRVWLTAVADPNEPSSVGSLATGVTESIGVHLPTIQELQDVSEIDDDEPHTTSPLFGEFVTIRTEDRQVVVTQLDTKGFWASDLGHVDDVPASVGGEYRGLFVYTFNAPEGVSVGNRLSLIGGGVQEYIGTTQLSFPIYEAMEGETLPVPDAAILTSDTLGSEAACESEGRPSHAYLETLESSLVTVELGTIPDNFREMDAGLDSHPDFDSYIEYGQWPLDLASGCSLQIVSNIAVPQFDPIANAGEQIGPITGMLKFVEAGGDRWIIQVVNAEGMPFVEADEQAKKSINRTQYGRRSPSLRTPPTPLCDHDHVGDHLRPHKD